MKSGTKNCIRSDPYVMLMILIPRYCFPLLQEVRRAEEVARDFLKNTSEKFGKPLSKRFRDKINSVKDDHVKRLRAEGKSDNWRVPRSKFLEEKVGLGARSWVGMSLSLSPPPSLPP